MSQLEPKRRVPKRAALIAAPFVAGAAVGAAVFAGVHGGSSAGPDSNASAAQSTATSPGNVASTTPQFDAQTIYDQDSPGVVDITVTESSSSGNLSPFGPGNGSQQAQAEGTGFVYDKQGDIVTAAHVVSGASKITVRFKDGTTASATLVGSDPSTDTAVIKVSVPSSKLTPLALGDSSKVEPGEGVVAIGSPFGYEESITAGIVSAIDRDITAPNGFAIPNTIQTDAAINHGNSGGPLIDSSGKVIGVNVQIATDDQNGGSTNAGVGFAVPSNTVKSVVDDLVAGRKVTHPFLGISVGDATSGSGAQVGSVRSGSPAEKAGLKAGDVIVSIDGQAITSADELTAVVAEHQPGDMLKLVVERSGSKLTLNATLGTRPSSSST